MFHKVKPGLFVLCIIVIFLVFNSCTRLLGYGVLLWSSDYPPIPSGTVLPVHIRSNLDQVWVVGIPKEFLGEGSTMDKLEIPLVQLELAGNRRRAIERAEAFAPFALLYAENLQDGLPIREGPDNTSRRVYRLRLGEIIKVLRTVSGPVPVGATGEPLEGEWFRVLTEGGTIGYCFSYRLKLFEHHGGSLAAAMPIEPEPEDADLEMLLSRIWSPEYYATMVNNRRIDLDELSRYWGFDPGIETGIARINIAGLDRAFSYTRIRSTGTRSWQFEGTRLQMNLRSDNTLAVQFTEDTGLLRTLIFVALRSDVDDLILQETARRESQFMNIFEQGPMYTSTSFGTILFEEDGRFNWTGNRLLVPQTIPAAALGSGSIAMRLFLSNALSERYQGAFTLYFDELSGSSFPLHFMYSLDSQGFRLEHVPQTSLDGLLVARRASTPLVMFFLRDDLPISFDSFDSFDSDDTAPERDFLNDLRFEFFH